MTMVCRYGAGLVVLTGCVALVHADGKGDKNVPAALKFTMKSLDGKPLDLAQYQGKVVLIVNVASECGFTPQYKGLQELYTKYRDKGLVVLGVPSNDFGRQEPGSNEDIAKFCSSEYGVTFPMTEKVVVKGADQAPLYKFLTSKETNPKFGGQIKWNFNKFLIGKNGEVVGRFDSPVAPESETLVKAVEAELAKK
jgi:glutathione peroxidase